LIFSAVSLLSGGREQSPPVAASVPSAQFIIPPDELFLPEEPDFLPGVLTQERRAVWTTQDAMPWWQDPLRGGEQVWRDLIEKTVDDIMESVP